MLRTLRRQLITPLIIVFLTTMMFGVAHAAVSPPNIVSYQGRVMNSNGVPVSSTTASMSFSFYNALSGGSCLWSNSDSNCVGGAVARTVTLTSGLFSENLGDTTDASPVYAAIPDNVFANNSLIYLEVVVNGETLTPRKRITAAPYALNSQTLDGLNSTAFVQDTTTSTSRGITFDSLADSTDVDITTTTGQSLMIRPTGNGFINLYSNPGGGNVTVSAFGAPTSSLMNITNVGGTSATPGVNGLLVQLDASADNNSGIKISGNYYGAVTDAQSYSFLNIADETVSNASGVDFVYGLNVANLNEVDPSNISSTALNIGTGWDRSISFKQATPIIEQANGSTLTFWNASASPLMTLLDSSGSGNLTTTGTIRGTTLSATTAASGLNIGGITGTTISSTASAARAISFPDVSGVVVTTGNLSDITGLSDSQISDTLTSSIFVGTGSATNAVDLGTAEISGTLAVTNGGTGASSASITAFNNITGYTASGSTGTTSTNLVFSTSPTITTSLVTDSLSFDLLNTVATTVNFAGAATALNLGSTNIARVINVGTGSAADTVNIGTGGGTDIIHIGDDATAKIIAIGNASANSVSITDDNWNVSTTGTADFVSIGVGTPGSGAFTTLSSTGVTTIGNSSSTVAIDSSVWDISSGGLASGLTQMSVNTGGGGWHSYISTQGVADGSYFDFTTVPGERLDIGASAQTTLNAIGAVTYIIGGRGNGTGAGGDMYVSGGASGSGLTGNGGTIMMSGGDSGASVSGNGGDILIFGGAPSVAGTAGSTYIDAGSPATGTAGNILIGSNNGSSVSLCNSANCDAVTIGTNADVDTLTIGDALDSTSINSVLWSIATSGVVTGSDFVCTDCLDFTEFADSLALDAATSITGTAGETFILTRSLTADADENGMTINLTTANKNGADDNIGLQVNVINTGTPTDITDRVIGIDIPDLSAATSATEYALTLGATWDAQIYFADSTSIVHLIDGGNLRIQDTDNNNLLTISDAGTTGNLTSSGTITGNDLSCTDCLDFTEFADSLALDVATTITGTAGETFTLTRTGTAASTEAGMTINYTGAAGDGGDTYGVLALNATPASPSGGFGNANVGLYVANITTTTADDSAIKIAEGNGWDYTIEGGGSTSVPTALFFKAGSGFTTADLTGGSIELRAGSGSAVGNSSGGGITLRTGDGEAGTGQEGAFYVTSGGGTNLLAATLTSFQINLDDTTTYTERLCHNGADGGQGFVNVGDCSGTPGDYAEQYGTSDVSVSAGDIVISDISKPTIAMVDSNGIKGSKSWILKTTKSYDDLIVGVVSTQPSDVIGQNFTSEENPRPIALNGRVPVNVTNENGSIAVGDFITTSSTAGKGMKATQVGRVVGMALSSFDGVDGQVMVQVTNTWYFGNLIDTDGTSSMFTDNVITAPVGKATANTPAFDSFGLVLRGSAWDGNQAQTVQMLMKNVVTDTNNYRLSVRNTTDSEVAYVTNTGTMQVAGDMVVGGKLYPSDQGVVQKSKYIYYDGSAGPAGDYMRTNAKGWSTGSYDFAEMFPSNQTLQPGDVVVFSNNSVEVQRSTKADEKSIAGIVSTRPGFLAGDNTSGSYPIALAGRVPTNVNLEGGAIAVGDPLTTSSKEGFAMKAKKAGPIVGYALEAFDGLDKLTTSGGSSSNQITVFVNAGYWGGESTSKTPGTNNQASQFAQSGNELMSALNMSGNINMSGNDLLSIGRIAGLSDAWSIESDGTIKTTTLLKTVITGQNNKQVETIAVTSPEAIITLAGTAKLENGKAEIQFTDISPDFGNVISAITPIRVITTPNGPVSLYVSEKDQNHFIVQGFGGNVSDVEFDWMVTAYRKGYEPVVPVVAPAIVSPPSQGGDEGMVAPAVIIPDVSSTTVTSTMDSVVSTNANSNGQAQDLPLQMNTGSGTPSITDVPADPASPTSSDVTSVDQTVNVSESSNAQTPSP